MLLATGTDPVVRADGVDAVAMLAERRAPDAEGRDPGTSSPVHVHDQEDETIFLIKGCGHSGAGDRRWELSSGDTAFLPMNLHRVTRRDRLGGVIHEYDQVE